MQSHVYTSIQYRYVETPTVPKVYRVGQDVEVTTDHKTRFDSVDYEGRKVDDAVVGMPSQVALLGQPDKPKVWIKLTRSLQTFLWEANVYKQYGRRPSELNQTDRNIAILSWRGLTDGGRCFTNRAGWDNGRCDYVQGINLTAALPEWEQLALSGNVLELTGRTKNIPTTYLNYGQGSYEHLEVRCVNVLKLPTISDFLADPAVCHECTTIRRDGTTGRFPQFDNGAVYPLWSTADTTWIWEGFVR